MTNCSNKRDAFYQAAIRKSRIRIFVDEHQATSVDGVFAAGDLVRGLNQISVAEGEAATASAAVHNRLGKVFA